jgi:hypothetical protein
LRDSTYGLGRFCMPKSGGFVIAKTPKWRSEIALPKRRGRDIKPQHIVEL